jgi:hypothetical protein
MPAFTRPEYSCAGTGLLANLTELVTSSETSNSAVSAVSMLIPRQESRNCRMYRRAQNGEVGSVASANVPASIALGSPGRRGAQAEPGGGAGSRVLAVMMTTPFLTLAGGFTTQGITLLWRSVVDSYQQGLT